MRWLMNLRVELFRFGIMRWVSANVRNDGPQHVRQMDPTMGSGSSQYRIYISTTGHERMIHASSEREAALKAEAALRQFHVQGLAARVRIKMLSAAHGQRLAAYLKDVTRELQMRD
jgi:hypothetical protein